MDKSPFLHDQINTELVENLNLTLKFFDEKTIGRDVFRLNNQLWNLFAELIEELKKHYPVDEMGETKGNC